MAKKIIKALKNATESLRPTAKMVGNSLDIDSIYNHSVPKKIKPKDSSDKVQDLINEFNKQWKKDNEARYAEMEKVMKDRQAANDIVFGTPEQISSKDYVSYFGPDDENVDIDNLAEKIKNENITREKVYQDRIAQSNNINEAEKQMSINNGPKDWTDADIAKMADGDKELYDELLKERQNVIDGKSYSRVEKVPEIDPVPAPSTSFKDAPDTEILDNSISTRSLSKMDIAMTGINVMGAIGDYKTARREGHGVVSSTVRAGAKFAIDEALGMWALPVALVKTVPGLAIKGADMLYKENRRMNSAANFQVFGGAQFMDTQQLATMRQSGMEMAKMANYNLQQTLMGNEATYLHR